MLLNRQKPMLRVGVAWWPGGRTRQRALGAIPSRTPAPRRRQRDLERVGTDHGIRVNAAAAVLGDLLGGLHLLRRMDLGDRFLGQRLLGAGRYPCVSTRLSPAGALG